MHVGGVQQKEGRMKVVFVSNYINHHQIPFCNAMREQLSEDFFFVQTESMAEERIKMGWGQDFSGLPYLHLFYEEEFFCRKLIAESDIVLFGGVDDESYIADRLREGKIVVRLSERLYKTGQWKAISPRGLVQKYKDHTRYRKAPVYLLCCGGYVASDFHIVKAYPGKMYKWGYFPAFKPQDVDSLMETKRRRREREKKPSLLWAGRFIDWKHPEMAILAAEKLVQEGYDFSLTMVGGGEMEEMLMQMTEEKHLSEYVTFAGFKKPEQVREYMENADIFLFTSDYGEGWGAVLNEAMNSCMAVVADCGIGAAPFLLKPGKNGMVYPDGNFAIFYKNLTTLIQNENIMEKLGRAAYDTVSSEWNAENAARKLLSFLKGLTEGRVVAAESGILSEAEPIAPYHMYRRMCEEATK